MITLGDILSNHFFKDFRFATEKIGLSNTISATGFFEWESKSDIRRTFRKGEFVVTTLSIAKDDEKFAEECLETLIANGPSVIAIKDIHFKCISKNLKGFAEKNNVPILFFSETYVDDVLFYVRMLLLEEVNNPAKKEKLLKLINNVFTSPSSKLKLINGLNPHFIDENVACTYVTKKDSENFDSESRLNDFVNGDFNEKHSITFDPANTVYMFIPFMNGLMFIQTGKSRTDLNVETITKFLNHYIKPDDVYVGISTVVSRLENLDVAIKESIYANTVATIKNESIIDFDVCSPLDLLCSTCYNPWVESFYNQTLRKINQQSNPVQLLETLRIYVECEGDIKLTSKILFQHGNTIRYRLSKIKSIMNTENDALFFNQAYSFINLQKIKNIMDPIFIDMGSKM